MKQTQTQSSKHKHKSNKHKYDQTNTDTTNTNTMKQTQTQTQIIPGRLITRRQDNFGVVEKRLENIIFLNLLIAIENNRDFDV